MTDSVSIGMQPSHDQTDFKGYCKSVMRMRRAFVFLEHELKCNQTSLIHCCIQKLKYVCVCVCMQRNLLRLFIVHLQYLFWMWFLCLLAGRPQWPRRPVPDASHWVRERTADCYSNSSRLGGFNDLWMICHIWGTPGRVWTAGEAASRLSRAEHFKSSVAPFVT